MSALPVLYSFRRCPYAIRARLALKASSTSVALREVALRHKPPALLAVSPKGTVPVLHLPNGTVMEESLDIMVWALQQHDPEGWLTQAPLAGQLALIERHDRTFKPQIDGHKYPERHPLPDGVAPWREQALAGLLGELNQRLEATPQVLGERPSLADMAMLPFVRQFAWVDPDWFAQAPLAGVRRWLTGHLASPLFLAALPDRKWPAWVPGDALVTF